MSRTMSNFDEAVENAINKHGYRVSRRMPTEYRLKRYIQLRNHSMGNERLSEDELCCVTALMTRDTRRHLAMMDNAWATGSVEVEISSNDIHTRTFRDGSGHPMVRRSQVARAYCHDACQNAVSVVKRTMNVSPRCAPSANRSHPMRLRSSN